MCTETKIVQSAGFGAHDNQLIGTQINYNGMTPEQAMSFAMELFRNNFPVLQETAEKIARERVEEFCTEVVGKLQRDGTANYPALADPGVQYTLVDAQKSYARYGIKEMLNTLTELVYNRVKHNDDLALKVIIDKAIAITNMLTPKQLDFLSLLFLCTKGKHPHIASIEDLVEYMNFSCENFDVSIKDVSISYLNTLGCLELFFPKPVDRFSEIYNLPKEAVMNVCPQRIKELEGDYGLSYVGGILAIINIEQKTQFRYNPSTWIHG